MGEAKARTPRHRASSGPGSDLQMRVAPLSGKSTPQTPRHPHLPPPGIALTIEVHVFILQVHLRSPRPLLRIQLCDDGVKEGDGLRHVRAELGVLLGGGFLLEVKGRGKGQSCVSQPARSALRKGCWKGPNVTKTKRLSDVAGLHANLKKCPRKEGGYSRATVAIVSGFSVISRGAWWGGGGMKG